MCNLSSEEVPCSFHDQDNLRNIMNTSIKPNISENLSFSGSGSSVTLPSPVSINNERNMCHMRSNILASVTYSNAALRQSSTLKYRAEVEQMISTHIQGAIARLKDLKLSVRGKMDITAVWLKIGKNVLARNIGYFDRHAWRLVGLSESAIDYILVGLDEDISDRVDFCKEFEVEQSAVLKEKTFDYALLVGNQTVPVGRRKFNSVHGKFHQVGDVSFKRVKRLPAQVLEIFNGPLRFIKGIQVIIRALTAAGQEAEAPVMSKEKQFDVVKLLIDLLNLVENGYSSLSIVASLMSFYKVCVGCEGFRAQSLDALAFSALTMCLPVHLFEVIKRLNTLTHAKLLDDMTMFSDFFTTVIEFMRLCVSYVPSSKIREGMLKLLDAIPFGQHYLAVDQMTKLCDKWNKDKTVILSDHFRNVVREVSVKRMLPSVIEWSKRSPAVQAAISDFTRLERALGAYDATSRVEPVCFVLEGPPGCLKSVTMNALIKSLGLSSYGHTVKAKEDGKDFYDTYNNQEIFFMDDVGQQGVSQFRNMINWVSSVKYPLECAEAKLKDTKYFSSSLIMMTTNNFMNLQGLTKDDCISNVDALWRRGYVFDFSTARAHGNSVQGVIRFKYYDVTLKQWTQGFPPEIDGLRDFPSECDAQRNRVTYLRWMNRIVREFKISRESQLNTNELTEQEILDINAQSNDVAFADADDGSLPYQRGWLYWLEDMCKSFFWNVIDGGALDLKNLCLAAVTASLLGAIVYCFTKKAHPIPAQNQFESVIKACAPRVEEGPPTSTIVTAVQKQLKFVTMEALGFGHPAIGLVSGHLLMVPGHLDIPSKCNATVFADGSCTMKLWDRMPVSLVERDVKEDYAVYTTNEHIASPFRNLYKLFKKSPKSSLLVTPVGRIGLQCMRRNIKEAHYTKLCRNGDVYENRISGDRISCYDVQADGLCGALLIDPDVGIQGAHVAGCAASGGVGLVWSEATISKLHELFRRDDKNLLDVPISDRIIPDFSGIKLQKSLWTTVPTTTKMVKSVVYGVMPVSRAPANLQATGPFTLKDIAKKSFVQVGSVREEDLAFAEDYMRAIIKPFSSIAMSEVVGGGPGLAGLNKNSSNGYGYKQGKTVYVDFDNNKLTEAGDTALKETEDRIRSGQLKLEDLVWVETLKDELRDFEKVDKPRAFRICTVVMQLITKRVFGNMVRNVMNDKWTNGVMVGINPLKDWQKLYDRVDKCDKKWAGDVPKWDGKMLPQVQHMIAEVIASRSVDDQFMAAFILHNMPHSIVAIMDDLYSTSHSMPSGSFLTAILNSLVNRSLTAMWYHNTCVRHGKKPSLVEFTLSIVDYVYGDDKLNATSLGAGFDMLGMREYFLSIGMDLTTADKKVPTVGNQAWSDITFLKRSFVFDSRFGKIICPLSRDTIFSSMSWYDKTKDAEVVLQGKLSAFQRECYLHPDYKDLMKGFLERLLQLGVEFHPLPEEVLHTMVMESDEQFYLSSLFVV